MVWSKADHPVAAVVAASDNSPEMVLARLFVKQAGWNHLKTRELNKKISAVAKANGIPFKELNRVVREALLSC